MKLPKKYQTFFYKRHFTSLVEVILVADSLALEVESALNLWGNGEVIEGSKKAVLEKWHFSTRETALLGSRNAVSR